MSEGFVLDTGPYSSGGEERWIEGAPVKSFWHGIQTKDRDAYAVTTYRCNRCGFLESYAKTPAK